MAYIKEGRENTYNTRWGYYFRGYCTAQGKIDALSAGGAQISETPWDIPPMVKELL